MRSLFRGVFAASLMLVPLAAATAAAPDPRPRADVATLLKTLSAEGAIKADQLLVKFKQTPTTGVLEQALAGLSLRGQRGFYQPRRLPAVASQMARWRVVTFQPGQNLTEAFNRLAADPAVEYVVPNQVFKASATPNDPLYPQLWGLHNTGAESGTAGADIDAAAAWNIRSSASDVVVAVIDTGVDYTHPDLAANMWVNPGEIPGNGIDDDGNGYIDDVHGFDFISRTGDPMDDNGHGTHVAGTIAAVGNNGIGITGVAWQARIMALKFLDEYGTGYTTDAIDAILYAADNGARISNNSWGASAWDRGGYLQNRPLEDAIRAVGEAGHLLIAAAGNDYAFVDDTRSSLPAGFGLDNIISVAATDRNDQLAAFSNWGPVEVDLAAPGVDILSTIPGGGYDSYSGTSMASPHVAGAAALLLSMQPDLSPFELRSLLLKTAEPLPQLADKVATGGRLNLSNALSELDKPACSSFTGTVASHISAGRASACGLYLAYGCAKGSNENIGSRYGSTPVTLVEQSAGHYVKGACGTGRNLPPSVRINGETETYLLKGRSYTPPAAVASDREDGDLTAQITRTGSVNTQVPGRYVISYDVADSAGASAVTAKALVHVLAEDLPPHVELFGRVCALPLICLPVYLEQHQPYVEDGYFGWDELDGDLTGQVKVTGSVLTNTSTIGRYQVRYDVTDSSGQGNVRKDWLYREVFVLDKHKPKIFSDEPAFYRVALGTCCDRVNPWAMDLKDEYVEVRTTGSVNMQQAGTYLLTHTATDSDGNTDTLYQTVQVVADVTPPTISLRGPSVMHVEAGDTWFNDPWADASDDLDRWPSVRQSGEVKMQVPGSYQLQYWAVDASGNQSPRVTRTVHVQAACQQYSATVASHISAGRAKACGLYGGNGCAVGSGNDLGSRYLYTPVIVREQPTGSGMFYKGACQ